jgi:arginyl-tRNA synthetase
MRKRDGNIYALIDLMREIGTKLKPEGSEAEQLESGKDVARFFYLMRSHDTTFDFDLDLAEKQSDENPVFYVQYAHARICSILEKAGEQGEANLALLTHPKEKTLIKRIADLPNEVSRAAEDYGVHRLTTYAIELARAFHGFYGDCKVISEDKALSGARVQLCQATKKALNETLDLLGVSAPERM